MYTTLATWIHRTHLLHLDKVDVSSILAPNEIIFDSNKLYLFK